jgi:hypothetical protein
MPPCSGQPKRIRAPIVAIKGRPINTTAQTTWSTALLGVVELVIDVVLALERRQSLNLRDFRAAQH